MLFKKYLAAFMAAHIDESEEDIIARIELPPDKAMGDYAMPCFFLAKKLRKAPPVIAAELCEKLLADKPGYIKSIENKGGYLNFFIDKAVLAEAALGPALEQGRDYGNSREGEGKTVCIDYSSINIAKRFHIGHLSTTAIGAALTRIYRALGYKVVGINHLGDWGTQFGKMIAAYKHWGSPEMVQQGGVDALTELYVRFHEEAEKEPSLEDEGRMWFKKIEDGDEEALAIFTSFKELTLKDAQRVYDEMGISFDSYAGESFYNDKTAAVVDELRAKGLLEESDGAYIVRLDDYNMPPCLILKSDGATLYSTRDLAAAIYRKKTYDFDKCLYVVAYQQDMHFKQVFKVLELMGYEWAKDLVHVSFGMVSYEGEALKTRTGHVVYLDDIIARSKEKALDIINEKNPDLENKEAVAADIGIGAVVYADLANSRIKDIDFRWENVLNFDGETGPYVQYTHARCCSVLKKAGELPSGAVDGAFLQGDDEQAVLKLLLAFPEAVKQAAEKYEPFIVTRHVTELAQAYNKFYYDNRILDADDDTKRARLQLTAAVKNCIARGLELIGVKAPEKM